MYLRFAPDDSPATETAHAEPVPVS
jgi:hypothetical protein